LGAENADIWQHSWNGVALVLAAKYFKLTSAQNRVLSQINYGTCLFHGQSVPIAFTLAVKYFKLAADQNHPDGLYRYGHCLQAAKGVHVDFTAAVEFYKLSTDLNRPDVQCHYGCFKAVLVLKTIVSLVLTFANLFNVRDFRQLFVLAGTFLLSVRELAC
jgi:TPR repeat protein